MGNPEPLVKIKPFRFLDLPPDIRQEIYILTVASPDAGVVDLNPLHDEHRFPSFPHDLLLANQQIYHEIRSIYFSHNSFYLTIRHGHNKDLLPSLAPEFQDNRREIKSLHIWLQRWGANRFFLDSFAPAIEDMILNGKLRELEVVINHPETLRYTQMGSLELSENWRALKRICRDPYLETVKLKAHGVKNFMRRNVVPRSTGKHRDITWMLSEPD
ncbi:uncharacterized protein BP5553_08549 [Venustampulla echinocandica]|uniref:Uncharacterized protein n=1 Tax=Venustampulla echinocandica TaxID=2656787 RepID=A0A370TEP3_9HELO|nr:uncharacterized protein BP5553_08549 [Venustampulla echinocandica]RDL33110.1 hypothetical protein BP5553_08549 [Venustampulla echinocandica]